MEERNTKKEELTSREKRTMLERDRKHSDLTVDIRL